MVLVRRNQEITKGGSAKCRQHESADDIVQVHLYTATAAYNMVFTPREGSRRERENLQPEVQRLEDEPAGSDLRLHHG